MALTPTAASAGDQPPALTLRRADVLVTLVGVAGAGSLAWMLLAGEPWAALQAQPTALLLLALALVLGEMKPIVIPRGDDTADNITISTTFAIALLAVGQVGLAALVQVLAVLAEDLRFSRPWRKIVFNSGQYALVMLAAEVAYSLASGRPLLGHSPDGFTEADVVPVLVAGAVFIVVNHALVSLVLAVVSGEPYSRTVVHDLRFSAATSAVLVSLAPLAAFVVGYSPLLLALLCTPILAVHRSAAQAMLRERQALHDALTGLANRELLQQRIARLLREHTGDADRLALLVIDLDHFKDVNDTLGHPVGDAILCEVAARLEYLVPDDALVARLGGDEFAVVVPTSRYEAERLAGRILQQLSHPAEVGDLRLLMQASIGVVEAPEHGRDVATLLKNADIAMYEAKQERARYCVYRPEADVNTLDRLELLSDLRVGLDSGQLAVVFQPQIDVGSGRIVAAEALVRWQHPTRGTVMPDEFISLAENSGLIRQLTAYVLDRALETTARLHRQGHGLRMAVNMSARHMSDLSLPEMVAEALVRHGVPPRALTLEVTETGILSDPVRVDTVVRQLRDAGVSIAVDDYGTGQAGLSYLKQLDVDELKIDKSFVIDMRTDSSDAIIVRSTIELGHALGLRLVAEGVEDAPTHEMLRSLGCDVAQGWHFGRPMSEAELVLLVVAPGGNGGGAPDGHSGRPLTGVRSAPRVSER